MTTTCAIPSCVEARGAIAGAFCELVFFLFLFKSNDSLCYMFLGYCFLSSFASFSSFSLVIVLTYRFFLAVSFSSRSYSSLVIKSGGLY
jgi:hypothetical protein